MCVCVFACVLACVCVCMRVFRLITLASENITCCVLTSFSWMADISYSIPALQNEHLQQSPHMHTHTHTHIGIYIYIYIYILLFGLSIYPISELIARTRWTTLFLDRWWVSVYIIINVFLIDMNKYLLLIFLVWYTMFKKGLYNSTPSRFSIWNLNEITLHQSIWILPQCSVYIYIYIYGGILTYLVIKYSHQQYYSQTSLNCMFSNTLNSRYLIPGI